YLYSAVDGRSHSMGTGLDYGGTLDIPVAEGWRAELLYSRQETDLGRPAGGGGFGLKLERYMVGIEEEKGGDDPLRFFGVLLAGVTRFAPGLAGYDADVRFTLGLSLGLKRFLSKRLAFRTEARGFFVVVQSGGGAICSGGCLYHYTASGLW